MESLTTTFDDKRYPYKYMLKAPVSGAGGFQSRLLSAAKNLGFEMPMARQLVDGHNSEGGQSHFLFAVALTQEDQYPRLLDELDRLTVEHFQSMEQTLAEAAGGGFMHDYAEQVAEENGKKAPLVRGIAYEDVDRETPAIDARDDLLADYADQTRVKRQHAEHPILGDDWELEM